MRRRLLQLIIVATAVALPVGGLATPARADNAGTVLSLVNQLRAAHGAGPLYADPGLTAVAQQWSAHMAAAGSLSHNPNVASGAGGGWTKLGENIGAGGSVASVFNALVNSPFHYANMVDPTYNLTGIGVVPGAGGTLWITEDFEAKPGATPATTPTTKPPTPAVARPPVTGTTAKSPTPATTASPAAPASAAPPASPISPASPASPPPSAVAATQARLPAGAGIATGGSGASQGAATPSPASPTALPGDGGLAVASLAAHHGGGSSVPGWAAGVAVLAVSLVSVSAGLVVHLLVRHP